MIINTKPYTLPPIIVDFGWFYGSYSREPEYTYTSNSVTYPPGCTVTSGSTTLPMSNGTITVVSTASFDEGPNTIVLNNGSIWASVTYTGITATTFTGCRSLYSGTFASDTPVWDPRDYVDSAPLQTTITFDALDSQNLGLPTITIPAGLHAVAYRWDFGNGQIGTGPTSSTIYPFDQAPPSTHITLTVTDNLQRKSSCSHPLYLVS